MKIMIKSLLAILLFVCLLKTPYGYYQFVRIAGFSGFAYLAYNEFTKSRSITGLLCTASAILFNPVFKIYFKRDVWNTIDAILAVSLLIWVVIEVIYLHNENRKVKRAYANG